MQGSVLPDGVQDRQGKVAAEIEGNYQKSPRLLLYSLSLEWWRLYRPLIALNMFCEMCKIGTVNFAVLFTKRKRITKRAKIYRQYDLHFFATSSCAKTHPKMEDRAGDRVS